MDEWANGIIFMNAILKKKCIAKQGLIQMHAGIVQVPH